MTQRVGVALAAFGACLMVLSVFLVWLSTASERDSGRASTDRLIDGSVYSGWQWVMPALIGAVVFVTLALALRRRLFCLGAIVCSIVVFWPVLILLKVEGFACGMWGYEDGVVCTRGPAPVVLLGGAVLVITGASLLNRSIRRESQLLSRADGDLFGFRAGSRAGPRRV